jgi:predicted transposase YdaD
MSIDNICKYLSEQYPESFATWILGEAPTRADILKTELSVEPLRADFVALLHPQERLLHLEFQVEPITDPPMPLRMLDYYVRLYRQHGCPIEQVVILLKRTGSAAAYTEQFTDTNTRHRYPCNPTVGARPYSFTGKLCATSLGDAGSNRLPSCTTRASRLPSGYD